MRKIITNNKDSWELYSTISESVITKFKTEKDLKKFIALEAVYKGKLEAIKELMCFPYGWTINEMVQLNKHREVHEVYYNWFNDIQSDSETYDDYYKKIDEKLQELLG